MIKSAVFVAALLLAGCVPDLAGSWDAEFESDGFTNEGWMDLYQSGSTINGDASFEYFYDCEDLKADISGDYDQGNDELELELDFEKWYCSGNLYDFSDMKLELDTIQDGPFKIVDLEGDGEWGSGGIDFEASR